MGDCHDGGSRCDSHMEVNGFRASALRLPSEYISALQAFVRKTVALDISRRSVQESENIRSSMKKKRGEIKAKKMRVECYTNIELLLMNVNRPLKCFGA